MSSIPHHPHPLSQPSRLRNYTTQYHDNPSRELIDGWISENPSPQGLGWEPYPLSLRIVNWIKWSLSGYAPTSLEMESLCRQADHLFHRVEYHLLANHLFSNAKALVFAGTFFIEPSWLAKGLSILNKEIPEQILADGGHFERSPMYHSLILEDMLDLTNLGRLYPGVLPHWSATEHMLGWLRNLLHHDGRIAFFNDAVFGVAPEPGALFDYAERLGIAENKVPLSDSGYIRLDNETTTVIFDAGPIGPDYQPGHAHADTLSFELSHAGARVMVNSGISTYERGPERARQRGTAAHNTVRIDGLDQSETWASFRVGRRARPLDVKSDGSRFAEAAHDGYKRLRQPVIHRRRIELAPDRLTVTDRLEGSGQHTVETFFHLHPDANLAISLDPKLVRTEQCTSYHPYFEVAVPKRTVAGTWSGICPVEFQTSIPLQNQPW
jgi:uncharacterized heparinase superfamily protein